MSQEHEIVLYQIEDTNIYKCFFLKMKLFG